MNISWEDARLFLAVAETGSLSAAAKKLRVAQPTVSRRLAEIEAELGEALFARGVAGATLTAFGEKLQEPARRMAEWAAEFERAAEKSNAKPEGVVRVTAAPGVAHDFVVPFAATLRTRLPDVRLEVVSTVRYLGLTRREADLALRMQPSTQRDHAVLASLEFDVAAYGSPALAARLPRPARLADADWIGWAPPFDHLSPNPELSRMIPGFRPAIATDDFLVQLRAAELGLGVVFLGRIVHRFSRDIPLVEIDFADLPPLRSGLHLISAKSSLAIPRVRAVADLLAAEIKRARTPGKPRKGA